LLEEGRAISPADITADFNTGNGQALAESPGFGVITAGMPGEPSSDAPGQPTGKYARGRDQYTPVSSAETDELSVPATLEEAGLTLREIEVLQLLSVGLTNKQIGERLTISRHTVNVHVKTIFSKLAVTSRAAATYFAVTNKLV
jgi:DNA-binding CsgD family transcriptional regulator